MQILSARSQRPLLVRLAATEVISVAGPAAVTPRLTPRPMGQPRPVEGVSSAGGARAGSVSRRDVVRGPNRMKRKFQVRFLGGGRGAIPSCYPVCDTRVSLKLCCSSERR